MVEIIHNISTIVVPSVLFGISLYIGCLATAVSLGQTVRPAEVLDGLREVREKFLGHHLINNARGHCERGRLGRSELPILQLFVVINLSSRHAEHYGVRHTEGLRDLLALRSLRQGPA